jgi:hypothetical protein
VTSSNLEKYRMAFAEAGYPNVPLRKDFEGRVRIPHGSVPDDVAYRAFRVVTKRETCFACWDRDRHAWVRIPECVHGGE